MQGFAQLDIEVFAVDGGRTGVSLDFMDGQAESKARLTRDGIAVTMDLDSLIVLEGNPERYGKTLRDQFFAEPALRSAFAAGRARAAALNLPLRVRLTVGNDVAHLNGLAWETLFDPESPRPLFMGEDIFFSRHLTGQERDASDFSPERAFKALVAVSSPSNLKDYGLADLDIDQEMARAEAGLSGIDTRFLASRGTATRDNILATMRNGADILYLVCHGMFKGGESWLLLEDETGKMCRVQGNDLSDQLSRQQQLPRLVVLISCNSSAGVGEDFTAALGPQLAQAGIPAVLAMRGKVSMATMIRFLPTFFSELQRDGYLERAMAVARNAVRDRPDWGMPVLFSRLETGRLWQKKTEVSTPAVSYDCLLWHHENDRSQVESLARRLEDDADLKPWLPQWHLLPGDDPLATMADICARGATLVAMLGPSAKGPWLDIAERDALAAALQRGKARVLPLVLPGAIRAEKESDLPAFLRRRIWAGWQDADDLEDIARGIRGLPAGRPSGHLVDICPFRGLEVFREEDRTFFFGREAITQRLHEHITQFPFLAVMGPSGSGKSSVVQAGLTPLLHQEGFHPVLFTPSTSPIEELAFALVPLYRKDDQQPPNVEDLVERLGKRDEGLYYILRDLSRIYNGEPVCLVIDQFEEIFTLAQDKDQVARFLGSLWYALEHPTERFAVVITMRSDFLGKCAVYPDLDDYITEHMIQVKPMLREDLVRAIEEPARLADLRFEPGLVDRLLEDLEGASGELPLLEHALLELYERRRGQVLTSAAYTEIGGIEGALAQRAESIYADLDEVGRKALTKMFTLCLIHPGEGAEDTRRRATREEILAAAGSGGEGLLDAFTEARLLTTSVDEARNLVLVDVAHEALIRKWDRIKVWMAAGRETARLLNQLRARARTWDESKRNEDYLIRGGQLIQIQELTEREDGHIGRLELDFVAACVAMVTRQSRQRRMVRHVMAVLAVLGMTLAVVAFTLFGKAKKAETAAVSQKALAEHQKREANYNLSLAYKMSAGNALKSAQPKQAWLLSLAGLAQDIGADRQVPEPATLFFDPRMPGMDRQRFISPAIPDFVQVAVGAKLLVLGDSNGVIHVIGRQDGRQVTLLTAQGKGWTHLALSPNEQWIAAASGESVVHLWRVEDGTYQPVANEEDAAMHRVAFSPDSTTLAAGGLAGWVLRYDLDKEGKQKLFGTPKSILDLAFDPKGGHLLIAGEDGVLSLHAQSGDIQNLTRQHQEPITTLTVTPQGQLVTGDASGAVLFRNLNDGKLIAKEKKHTGAIQSLAVAPSGKVLSTAVNEWLLWDTVGGGLTGRTVKGSTTATAMSPNDEPFGCADNLLISVGADDKAVLRPIGHHDVLNSIAVSPEGNRVATASFDQTIQLWPMDGKQLPTVLKGHTKGVMDVVFSPDGRQLASASSDGTVGLWTPGFEDRPRFFREHSEVVMAVAFSPNGAYLASASFDKSIVIRHLVDKTSRAWTEHQGRVWTLAYAPDGNLLASGSADKTVILWTPSGQVVHRLRGHQDKVVGLAFSPDGKLLATASYDHAVFLWDVATGVLKDQLTDANSPVNSVAFSSTGNRLVSVSNDHTIYLYDVNSTGVRLNDRIAGHTREVRDAVFFPDGQTLATASGDRTWRLWDVQSMEEKKPPEEGRFFMGGGFSADGSHAVTFDGNKTLSVSIINSKQSTNLFEPASELAAAGISNDGRIAVIAETSGPLYWWDVANQAKTPLVGHLHPVNAVAVNGNGSLIASASKDQTVRLWHTTRSDSEGPVLSAHEDAVLAVAFSPTGEFLVSGGMDSSVRLWRTDGALHNTLAGHEDAVTSATFSPDGVYVATGSFDQTIKCWDVATGELLQTLTGLTDIIMGVAIQPEGGLIAGVAKNQTAAIWDPVTGRMLGMLSHQQDSLFQALSFSKDGKRFLAPRADMTLGVWQIDRFPRNPQDIDAGVFYDQLLQRSLAFMGYHLDNFQVKPLPRLRLLPTKQQGHDQATWERPRPKEVPLIDWLMQ